MTITASRQLGVAALKTRHFSIALKGRRYARADRPPSLSIPLGFGRRLTMRLR